jgi:hypothetical protein
LGNALALLLAGFFLLATRRNGEIFISTAAFGIQVFPPELLDRRLRGGQVRASLAREARQRRQDRFLVVIINIDLVNGKAGTAVEMPIECCLKRLPRPRACEISLCEATIFKLC